MSPSSKDSSPLNLQAGYSYPTLLPLVRRCLEKGVSVMVKGHPGVGKSAMAWELANAMGLPMVDIRLAQKDPAELGGVYIPNHTTKTLELYPPDWVRQVCDAPHFLFLDEINAAVSKLHQAAAYQIILEHQVGPFRFHPQTVVMAAGNLEEDEALAVPLSSALQNRFCHYTLNVNADAWIDWAIKKEVSADLIAYIAFRREPALYHRTGEDAYPSPRSWGDLAGRVDGPTVKPVERKRLIASAVGQAHALEFMTFLDVYRTVDVDAILQHGRIPDLVNADPAFVHSLTFAIGHLIRTRGIKTAMIPHLHTLFTTSNYGAEFQTLLILLINKTKAFQTICSHPLFVDVRQTLLAVLTPAFAS